MSERNLEQEIDEIKKQLNEIKEIKEMLTKKTEEKPNIVGHVRKSSVTSETFENESPEIKAILGELEDKCGTDGNTGRITYVGVFASGGRQSTWVSNGRNTDNLLRLIETGIAEKVLKCIGNNDRLNILLALLRKPMTVAELVAEGRYNSTGQVYHHLKPLITADLVTEDKQSDVNIKGKYIVQPHKVQGIIMLLAGINDMIDERYTKGDWEQAQQESQQEGGDV